MIPRPGETWYVPRVGLVLILDEVIPALVTYRLADDPRGDSREARRFRAVDLGFAGWRRRDS